MKENRKTVIAVVGPTAVGKTDVGIRLAQHFQTAIISADSRQCYREMNIGVARPTPEELSAIPHHFIATHSIQEDITAADFESFALESAQRIFSERDRLLLVGGTGLYIRAFLEGLDVIPEIDPAVRENVLSIYSEMGLEGLSTELERLDPDFFRLGEMKNPQRMMRALEVVMSTGESILSYRSGEKKVRPFDVKWVGLELPRETLIDRIDLRVDAMIEAGWLEEAKQLYPQRSLNAMQTVGYKELFEYFEGKYTLEHSIELIKIATRQYAKRQMTWFRRNPSIRWFAPTAVEEMIVYLEAIDPAS
ncbi:MAG: tRNA (adenosine(37)-N6)-dimethylallyltransferase MiaA [Bacteroidetes bacterium]|nr:tRNA (adenosine(37)-N6)-dimethylallyltransferase MiaA [Bacteroidota bacterium]